MISGDITTPFAEDGGGGVFFVTSVGLFHWEAEAIHRFPLHAAPSIVPVAVYRDSRQRIWVGTTNGVVQLVLRKNNSRDLSDRFDQIPSATVSIHANHIELHRDMAVPGNVIPWAFKGVVQERNIAGSVHMGEYGNATWTALKA